MTNEKETETVTIYSDWEGKWITITKEQHNKKEYPL